MGFIEENLPEALIRRVNKLRSMDLLPLRASLELSRERIQLLQDVVRGDQEVDDLFALLDIHLYCLNAVFPAEYKAARIEPHGAASKHDVTYDPVKNGQNVIKHGITFGEARSFSPGFGTLIIPYLNTRDVERVAIFSKLVVPHNCPLVLPLEKYRRRSDLSTMTIAIPAGAGFRFISSRAFGKEDSEEALNNAAAKIYPHEAELERKKAFIEECRERVETDLFGDEADAGDHGPLRLIRAKS